MLLVGVLDQTYQDSEYIRVDNCSRAATPAIVQEFARQHRRIRQELATPRFCGY